MELKTVLLIEDESDTYFLVNGFLQAEGFEVYHAGSIAEAGYFLDRKKPALVLLDNRLPDGHGMHFINKLREKHPAAKVVVISGVDVGAREYALESGADAFIRKPFTKDTLLGTVGYLMKPTLSAVE